MSERISFNDWIMEITEVVAKRSTCVRRKIGAVIVKDKNIVSTGYNGSPTDTAHCLDIGCMREEQKIASGTMHEKCRALHGEMNAILQCAKHGKSCDGATIYVNMQPCIICSKMIINAGIKKVIYKGDYPDEDSLTMLNEAGIEIIKM